MTDDTIDPTPTGRSGFAAVCSHLFAVSTVLFLLAGAVIVVCQIVLIVAAQGMVAIDVAEAVGPYAFGTSSVAGLLAFVLTYFNKGESKDGE
ncbi:MULTISPECIES: hypothetical protein [unclassified Brevibacterium]|uniref:hypothetical protein n=1 Tax=unclassified Brevibacterium TaxID=2614124 RepID=UPI001E35529E|nr:MULTISPECIES: hypothetical protein [unclassified Brevibacterium]MCD1284352.1 hypothetical protein [Brevibacterium sp. CCUG 69071]MDK8436036.1 hypothetical protein [Brevibacterium sp. H-BE7]